MPDLRKWQWGLAALAVILVGSFLAIAGSIARSHKAAASAVAAPLRAAVDDPMLVAALTRGGPSLRDAPIHVAGPRHITQVVPTEPDSEPAQTEAGPTPDQLDGLTPASQAVAIEPPPSPDPQRQLAD